MNAETPRRLTGSLLERAAGLYDYAPLPPVVAPRHDPVVRAAPEVFEVSPPLAPPRRHAEIDRARLAEVGLLVPGAPVTPLAEEFRLVKRQLLATSARATSGDADRARTILVCSARPGDGKTFCAANLAMSLAAERDFEVLLVDADIAKPDMMARLGVEDGPGLLDAIGDEAVDIEACVVETDVPQLTLLPAGTRGHADTELLSSERARRVIAGLSRAHPRRIVVLDSPPVLAASPAVVLAGLSGQVMLVVRADRTSETDLKEAVARLSVCDEVQLLLNAVSLRPGGARFGDYYGYGEQAS